MPSTEKKEDPLSELISRIDTSNLSEEQKEAIELARYRLLLIDYSRGDPILEAHMIARLKDLFARKKLSIPDEIKSIMESESMQVRDQLSRALVEKRKKYSELHRVGTGQNSNANDRGGITDKTVENYLSYEQSLRFLDDIESRKGIRLGLANMSKILGLLGNPQNSYKVIHVAGTNGKGSVCAMIDSILESAGYKVGRYISPHLISFNERIMINSEPIPDDKVAELVNRIRPYLKKISLTYFEIVTLMSFLHFKDEKVDFAVVEVGMGGRLDATNTVMPLVSVITHIDLDHTEHLGKTIRQIAQEKSGIIKSGAYVVAGCEGEALEIIKDACIARNAILLPLLEQKVDESGLSIGDIGRINLGLKGEFQRRNAQVAATAIKALEKCNIKIDDRPIKIGLANVLWPGRLDFVENNVLVDCAHNPSGMSVLAKEIEKLKARYHKVILVMGMMKDKDIKESIIQIIHLADKVVATQARTDRAQPAEMLAGEISKYKRECEIVPDVPQAVERARSIAGPDDLVVIAGSIYVAGEAISFLKGFGNIESTDLG